jgi:hypothetical protein
MISELKRRFKMKKFSVTKNGKELNSDDLYNWDESTLTFSSYKGGLVLDFSDYDDVIFNTGSDCTFKTGSRCIFKTGFGCTFNTGSDCIFNTGFDCIFNTGLDCTFNTGSDCAFNTGSDCTFNTGSDCIFNTGFDCTFNAGSHCVVIRRDVFDVIIVPENQKIRLNCCGVSGYEIISNNKIITIDGKDIEISEESYEQLKKQLTL